MSAAVLLQTNDYCSRPNRLAVVNSKGRNSLMCFCGETFDSHDPAGSLEHRQDIYTTQRTARAR
jgi:hypothetical protein